jgi:hypothetical protein
MLTTRYLIAFSLALATCSLTSFAAAQSAPPDKPDADPRCDFNPPSAVLVAADYADYHVKRNHDESRPPQQLTETAALADGTRVTVVSDSCVDSFGREFRFRFAHASHASSDTAFWAATVSKVLSELHLDGDIGSEVSDLRDFLARAPKLHRHRNDVVQCHDKTQPEDGSCSWESHGSYRLSVERKGDGIEVDIGVEYSG